MLPVTYGSTYRVELVGKEGAGLLSSGTANLRARKMLGPSADGMQWTSDSRGLDGFYISAYRIKNFTEIQKRMPFILKNQFVLRNTEPNWPVDANGWVQVYEKEKEGKAWVQTQSGQISSLAGTELPKVRALVRYQIGGEASEISYSYMEHDPEKLEKRMLGRWNKNWKPLSVDPQASPVRVLDSDSGIATEVYMLFMLDPSLVKKRNFYGENQTDTEIMISEDWKVFQEKTE